MRGEHGILAGLNMLAFAVGTAEESTVVAEGPRGATARAGLADSFDDKEGYYTFTVRTGFADFPLYAYLPAARCVASPAVKLRF